MPGCAWPTWPCPGIAPKIPSIGARDILAGRSCKGVVTAVSVHNSFKVCIVTQDPNVDAQWIALEYSEATSFNEAYGFAGSQGKVHVEAILMRPKGKPSKTLLYMMHPASAIDILPVPSTLVAQGFHVLCGRSRYLRNDTTLIFEKVLLDFGAWIRHAKEVLGYEKVILVGWSGGGSLSMFYQSQAENPTITHTPAGDPIDIVKANLIPADGVVFQAAAASRASLLLDALDPSVTDELNPAARDPKFDLYAGAGGGAPYSEDFLLEYRAAQLARMRKITSWVRETLADLRQRGGSENERGFVVHRTLADPRYLDPAVDPNDRTPNKCVFGDPETANSGPMGWARYCSLRSWLSQWSVDDSRADAIVCAETISVPFLAIENTADDGAPASGMRAVFDASRSASKTYETIVGANHYYAGQPDLLIEAINKTRNFLVNNNLYDA